MVKRDSKLESAVDLYKQEKITVSRAAEIAGVDYETMRSILKEEGIIRRGREDEERDTGELEEMVS